MIGAQSVTMRTHGIERLPQTYTANRSKAWIGAGDDLTRWRWRRKRAALTYHISE